MVMVYEAWLMHKRDNRALVSVNKVMMTEVDWDGEDHAVRIHALVSSHPGTNSAGNSLDVTTLAIRMEQTVAMTLFQQIRALALSRGWPLPPEA